jgi:hypothetical protein
MKRDSFVGMFKWLAFVMAVVGLLCCTTWLLVSASTDAPMRDVSAKVYDSRSSANRLSYLQLS